jgi:pimeloyl-ACP methyl ester carboxylesterase
MNDNVPDAPAILTRPDGATIAYRRAPGKGPTVVFLGGFKSDMTGTKATALDAHCRAQGRAFLRFDYFGHGASSGDFRRGTIGRWADDALAAVDILTDGPLVLVGSSMGGWIMLLAALARPERIKALIGIAPAPDFTEDLMWAGFSPEIRAEIETKGEFARPSAYDPDPYPITRGLIEDGRKHLVMREPIRLDVPVRILQGLRDPDVPWRHALKLVDALESKDVVLELIKDGDHRLSEPADIARLLRTVDELCAG